MGFPLLLPYLQAPAPVQIGEVNVLASSAATWTILGTGRLAGL